MTTLLDTEIKYDRTTKDYAVYIAGQIVGYGKNYREAEEIRTAEIVAQRVIARRAAREEAGS